MLRLIIADDERVIREAIYHMIDWKALGIEVVGVCKNGLEAYDAIIDEYPDIVLTDIKMPGLSGLELIEKLNHTHERSHFIILSGYEEFDYAKQAMRCGVRHYLLKPCNEQQIIAAIRDIEEEIYASRTLEPSDSISSDFEKSIFRNLLSENISSDISLGQLINSYQYYLDFSNTPYTLYFLYYLEEHNLNACQNSLSQYMSSKFPGLLYHMIYVKNSLLLLVKNAPEDVKGLENFLTHLTFPVQTVSVSCKQQHFNNLEAFFTYITPKLQRYDKLYYLESERSIPIYNHTCCLLTAQRLCQKYYCEEKNRELLKQELSELFQSVQEFEFLMTLVMSLLLKQLQKTSASDTLSAMEFFRKMNTLHTTEQILALFHENFDLFFPPQGSTRYKPFIEKLLEYTESHLSDSNLSLKWIANNYLYMNVDYVSKQFIRQTGEKFSGYLNRMRIEKAKTLLLECDTEKIYMVAEQVGCGNNPQYFSQLFKKYTQMTPTDYIRQHTQSCCERSQNSNTPASFI